MTSDRRGRADVPGSGSARRECAPAEHRLPPAGSRLGGMVTVKFALHEPDDLDDEATGWMRAAYETNR